MSFTIYFDEDSQDKELIRILRTRGLTVTCVNEHGMRNKPDEEQLAFANTNGWVIFTHDIEDYCRLNSRMMHEGKSHCGIIASVQKRHHLGERALRIVHIHSQLSAEDMKDRLEYLSNW
jgi:predicted nuclease of predicted toxin-antitoxin system